MKKIGIILVNYNGLEDTIECVNSINNSHYDNYKIFIIDNNSTENSSQLVNFKNVFYKKLDSNLGFGVANNIGTKIAINDGCELILCLNNDTVIEPATLKNLAINTDNKTITTGSIYYYFNRKKLWYGGGQVSRLKGTFRHKKYTSDRNVSFISGCCMMFTPTCYQRIGLFDPAYFMYYEDADFSLKAQKSGYKLKYIFNAKVYHKVGRSINKSVGLKDYYLTRNRLYILNKYDNYFFPSSIVYFYFTRFFLILKCIINKENYKPIINGIHDYKKGKIGKTNGSV